MQEIDRVKVTVHGEVRRLALNPGDQVVVCFRERLPLTAIREVKRELETYFPRNAVLVIAGVETLAVLPAGKDVPQRIDL